MLARCSPPEAFRPRTNSCWIIVAMIAARSAAMAFNRLADASIDAANPRTSTRRSARRTSHAHIRRNVRRDLRRESSSSPPLN